MHVLLKCASVVCVMTRRCCGVRKERLLRRKGGGGCCLSVDHYGKRKLGGVLSSLQITSTVGLVVLYYINFTTGADLTISVR